MRIPLRHLALFVTESCNLACPYCYAARREGRHIDPSLAEHALALALGPDNPAPTVTVTFWGGEPLLRYDLIVDLVRFAEKAARGAGKQVRFSLPTNTTLLEEAHLTFFQAHRVALSLSLDGGPRAQALRMTTRGASSFDLVLEKLDLIAHRYERRLPPVRMTVSPETVPGFVENVMFFLDRGFDRLFFAPVVEAAWSDETFGAFEAGQSALVDLWVAALRQGRRVGFHTWDRAVARSRLRRKGILSGDMSVPCRAGSTMLAVDIHGDIYPCHRFVFYDKAARAMSLGNVADGGPDQEKRAFYAGMTRATFASSTVACRDCPLSSRCFQACPALNYALRGELETVDDRLCKLAAIEARIADKIETVSRSVPELAAYLERLEARAISSRDPSSFWYHQVDEADVERLARKAEELLARLGRNAIRRDLERPGANSATPGGAGAPVHRGSTAGASKQGETPPPTGERDG